MKKVEVMNKNDLQSGMKVVFRCHLENGDNKFYRVVDDILVSSDYCHYIALDEFDGNMVCDGYNDIVEVYDYEDDSNLIWSRIEQSVNESNLKTENMFEDMFKLGYAICDNYERINFEKVSKELQDEWRDLIVDDFIEIAMNIQQNEFDMCSIRRVVDEGDIFTNEIDIIKKYIKEYIELKRERIYE